MKNPVPHLVALIAAATSFLHAEEAAPKFSLAVRWTPAGGEVVETKVPAVALDQRIVRVPVERGPDEVGDPTWHAEFDFRVTDGYVEVEVEDHARLKHSKDHGLLPVEVFSARFQLVWNEEVVLLESPRGKLSFVAGLVGRMPETAGKKGSKLPADLASKIEFSHKVVNRAHINYEVYNPTEYLVQNARFRVKIPASEGFAAFDRAYQVGVSWSPLSDRSGTLAVPKLIEYPEGTPVEVTLEKAY